MRSKLPLRITVTTAAVVIAVLHVWRPDIRIDSITVILLAIGSLPWVQPLLKSIELLGVKLELQELQEKVAEAKGAAESASQQAGLALSASSATSSLGEVSSSTSDDVLALAREYNQIRESQSSGSSRTAAMTDVVRRMIDVARRLDVFDVEEALRDRDRGKRLFAYAYLYCKPDARFILPLVESVTQAEDRPFGQYWGLQSIGRVLGHVPTVHPSVSTRLRKFSTKLRAGTDRDYELRKILEQLDKRSG